MRKNKTLIAFCCKVILLLLILLGVDRLVGITFVSMKDCGLKKNPENRWLKTAYAVEKVNTDIIIIGSSKASHHYIPNMISEELGMSTYNCGQDGCFFLYQNCIINMILDRYSPKMILWDIQPSSFTGQEKNKEYQNIRYLSPYYRGNIWVKNFIDSESMKMPFLMSSCMFAYNSKFLNYVFPLVINSSVTNNGYIPLGTEGYSSPQLYIEKDNSSNHKLDELLKLLSETIGRCKSKGVDLHLYISPEYSEKCEATKEVESEIEKIALLEDVPFANYHSLPEFMNDSSLFKDAGHLNDKGAKVYTSIVLQDLRRNIACF